MQSMCSICGRIGLNFVQNPTHPTSVLKLKNTWCSRVALYFRCMLSLLFGSSSRLKKLLPPPKLGLSSSLANFDLVFIFVFDFAVGIRFHSQIWISPLILTRVKDFDFAFELVFNSRLLHMLLWLKIASTDCSSVLVAFEAVGFLSTSSVGSRLIALL